MLRKHARRGADSGVGTTVLRRVRTRQHPTLLLDSGVGSFPQL